MVTQGQHCCLKSLGFNVSAVMNICLCCNQLKKIFGLKCSGIITFFMLQESANEYLCCSDQTEETAVF